MYASLTSTPQPEQYSLIIRREKRLGAKKVCTIFLDCVKCPIVRVSSRKIVKGGGGGDVQKGVLGTPHTRGGLGACPPRKILNFRPSEITSGTFSSRFTATGVGFK